MKYLSQLLVLAFALLIYGCSQNSYSPPKSDILDARFTTSGELILPNDLDHWVFLGSSLGMGYSNVEFDPDTPGNFQIVSMEPKAYAEFMRTGKFPDGSMFALAFYGAKSEDSVNEAGFVMGELQLTEIHLKDRTRFPDTGFSFYMFDPGAKQASALNLPNDCVTCHKRDAEHDGVFTQFYPVARNRLKEE